MTSHQEWFTELREPERPRYVETGHDMVHNIEHVGDVALSHVSQRGHMKNVLHIPTIDVGRTDCRPRNVSTIQPRRMLY